MRILDFVYVHVLIYMLGHMRILNVWVTLVAGDDEETGTHKSELINWYLKEMEHDIDTEAELVEKKMIVEKVVHKLIHVVGI